uniref:Uncharacterized protein n=1 Tax=Aegilops tauschii subsp. strangulata TaxID=200361 RepID=A0A453M148_AEGTS
CSFRGQVHEHLQGVPLRRIWLSKTEHMDVCRCKKMLPVCSLCRRNSSSLMCGRLHFVCYSVSVVCTEFM